MDKKSKLLNQLPSSLLTCPIPNLSQRCLYQNEHLFIVDKPPLFPSTGRTLDDADCIQYWVMAWQRKYLWAIHQLDADTSGLLFFTDQKKKVHPLNQMLSHPESIKTYWGLVYRIPSWTEYTCTESIGLRGDGTWGETSDGKSAFSHFRLISHGSTSKGSFSLLQIQIKTGRTHQIRIHLQLLGHPLIGEEWYIDHPCSLHSRQALHFTQFQCPSSLPSPLTSLSGCDFHSPFPSSLCELAGKLGMGVPSFKA